MDEFLALAYAKERQLPVTIARLFNTVGPRQTGRYGMVLPRFVAAARAGQPLPDHGKQEYDLEFHGGNYAAVHPGYYRDTGIAPESIRAPDHGDLDIVAEVLPKARKMSAKMEPPKCVPTAFRLYHLNFISTRTVR